MIHESEEGKAHGKSIYCRNDEWEECEFLKYKPKGRQRFYDKHGKIIMDLMKGFISNPPLK